MKKFRKIGNGTTRLMEKTVGNFKIGGTTMKAIIQNTYITLLAICLLITLLAWGQTGEDYDLSRSTVASGGGTISGGNFTMTVTIGEPYAGVMTGGDFTLIGGVSLGYFGPPIEAGMKFTPQTLNRDSKGKWVKAHFVLPEEFSPEDVDVNESALARPMGIESHHINVFVNDEGAVEVEVAFDREAFCDTVADDGIVEVTVIGSFTTGQYFYGSDTIRIIDRQSHRGKR